MSHCRCVSGPCPSRQARASVRVAAFVAAAVLVPLSTPVVAHAQQTLATSTPKPILSPRDTTRATVGSANVLVDYGRPSKRGRVIFGGLVPYDSVWRTGANAATTLVTDKPLVIGGVDVPAGTYTLYSIPSKTEPKLIINKQTGQWGTVYKADMDFARVPMTVTSLSSPVEKFEIAIRDGRLHLIWDTTDESVSIADKK